MPNIHNLGKTRSQSFNTNVPEMIEAYSTYMRGVDYFNQICSYYLVHHRSIKWYRRIFYWLFEISINNSFILYQIQHQKKNFDMLDFRILLIDELQKDFPVVENNTMIIEETKEERIEKNSSLEEKLEELRQDTAETLEHKQICTQSKGSLKECDVCSNRAAGNRRRTKWGCAVCGVGVHPQCFSVHFIKNFKLL